MIVIGITGGIGSGKSFVTKLLKEEFGAAVIDTDSIGHDLILKDGAAYEKVLSTFGPQILDERENIDRKKLGNLVFHDEKKLGLLNKIIHPLVEAEVDRRLHLLEAEGVPLACLETAILKDVGYEKKCDEVWFVYSEKEKRMERLLASRSITEEKVEAIFNKQRSDEAYRMSSDRVIDNSFSNEETLDQIRLAMNLIRGGKNAGTT